MKKTIYFAWIAVAACIGVSCTNEIDNYDAPAGGIKGTVYDAATNEPIPLPTQGDGGVLVNLFEQHTGATRSVDFRAKQDGTYENSQLFDGEYKIVVNGPFVDKCEGAVTVQGQTTCDLKATPYSRIDIQAAVDAANRIRITYSAVPSNPSFTVSEVSLMWNFAPGVDVNSSNYAAKATAGSSSGTYTFDLAADKNFNDNLYKIVSNGKKIYVRAAAEVKGNINYSNVVELQIN